MNRRPTTLTWVMLNGINPALIPVEAWRTSQSSQNMREMVNAVFYIVKAGCTWRLLPHDLPSGRQCITTFRRWEADGAGEKIHDYAHSWSRKSDGTSGRDLQRGDCRYSVGKTAENKEPQLSEPRLVFPILELFRQFSSFLFVLCVLIVISSALILNSSRLDL